MPKRKPTKKTDLTSQPIIKRRLSEIPSAYLGQFEKAYSGELGKVPRIKLKCLDCCSYQRLEITNCTVIACPLWPIRPYQP